MAYIALEIPQKYSEAISGRTDAVLHITMCHLGKITWEQSQKALEVLARGVRICAPSMYMRAKEFQIFGTPAAPALVRRVECTNFTIEASREVWATQLEAAGLTVDRTFEPWTPHITIGPGDHTQVSRSSSDTPFVITRVGLFAAPMVLHYSLPFG